MDMLAHAIDTPAPATIILISGDRDFAYAVSTLRLRRYRVVVISAGEVPVHPSLKAHASIFLDWHTDVLLSEVVDEGLYFPVLRSNKDAKPLAASSPSRRYSMASAQGRSGSEDTGIDIMDHLHLRDSGTTTERLSRDVNSASNHSYSPDSRVDGPRSSRAPSRTESAPAAVYLRSDFSPASTALSDNPIDFNSNTPVQPSRSRTPSQLEALGSFLSSPQIKKGAQDGNTTVGRLPSALLPDSASFVVQYPQHPLTATTVQTTSTDTTVPPSLESAKPVNTAPQASSKECPPAITAPIQSRKSIPPGFEPLIQKLESYRSQGVLRPFRSKVALELATPTTAVYRRVGVERFGQYADMAVKAGIIELGGKEGGAWIALRPEWYGAKPT